MPFICVAIIAMYLLFLPPSSSVDPDTAADDTTEYDYYVDDQPLVVELPGKQSPSPLPDITYLFHIILALGIVAATVIIPIPLHYMSLSPPLLLYPTFILCCSSCATSSVGPTPLSVSYA